MRLPVLKPKAAAWSQSKPSRLHELSSSTVLLHHNGFFGACCWSARFLPKLTNTGFLAWRTLFISNFIIPLFWRWLFLLRLFLLRFLLFLRFLFLLLRFIRCLLLMLFWEQHTWATKAILLKLEPYSYKTIQSECQMAKRQLISNPDLPGILIQFAFVKPVLVWASLFCWLV